MPSRIKTVRPVPLTRCRPPEPHLRATASPHPQIPKRTGVRSHVGLETRHREFCLCRQHYCTLQDRVLRCASPSRRPRACREDRPWLPSPTLTQGRKGSHHRSRHLIHTTQYTQRRSRRRRMRFSLRDRTTKGESGRIECSCGTPESSFTATTSPSLR